MKQLIAQHLKKQSFIDLLVILAFNVGGKYYITRFKLICLRQQQSQLNYTNLLCIMIIMLWWNCTQNSSHVITDAIFQFSGYSDSPQMLLNQCQKSCKEKGNNSREEGGGDKAQLAALNRFSELFLTKLQKFCESHSEALIFNVVVIYKGEATG